MPEIAKSAFVDKAAQIIGDVIIGKDSSVWPNCVLRGDVHYIRVGERTNIQDGSVLHGDTELYPVILEDDITVGHLAILHGCTIRSRALIGMGAKLLNGSEVEADAVVAAGSLLPEGKKAPSGWLTMGIPAKPVRELTEKEKEGLLESSRRYVDLKNDYLR